MDSVNVSVMIDLPLVFENVQTDSSCDRADVGMPDPRHKLHLASASATDDTSVINTSQF